MPAHKDTIRPNARWNNGRQLDRRWISLRRRRTKMNFIIVFWRLLFFFCVAHLLARSASKLRAILNFCHCWSFNSIFTQSYHCHLMSSLKSHRDISLIIVARCLVTPTYCSHVFPFFVLRLIFYIFLFHFFLHSPNTVYLRFAVGRLRKPTNTYSIHTHTHTHTIY